MDGARGDDAMPPLPSKLDCILRRLIWLGAPKVPYSKTSFDLREASNFKKPIQNLIRLFQFLGIDGVPRYSLPLFSWLAISAWLT